MTGDIRNNGGAGIGGTGAGGGVPNGPGNSAFSWNQATAQLTINANTSYPTSFPSNPATAGQVRLLMIGADGASNFMEMMGFGTTRGPGTLLGFANGTCAAPTAVVANDRLGFVIASGFNGTGYFNSGSFQFNATENFVAGANGGTSFQLLLAANGSVSRTTKLMVNGDGTFLTSGARADQSYSLQVPTTGFAITPASTVERLILNPAGTLATGTVTMPATPNDGQIFKVATSQVITSFTVQANAGQTLKGPFTATAFVANATAEWTYVAASTTWFRTGN